LKIRVAIVDDHRVVQSGLKSYLESFDDIEVIVTLDNGEQALARLPALSPDVVVMDLNMPGGMDGIEATKKLGAALPKSRVVVLTAATDDARLVAALRAGAVGYVRKDAEPSFFLAAVRAASEGRTFLDPAASGPALKDLVHGGGFEESLTDRESEVLRELARGKTNREIAETLRVGEETVKTHVGNILSKLQLDHRTQAVVYALKKGLLSLDEIELPGATGR
jgi:two-component system, NarL family, response regulator LiaR